MNILMDNENEPTPHFKAIIEDIVRNTISLRHRVPQSGDFYCPAVCNQAGNVSYWGVIDFRETPEEDLYLEIERRFYSAAQTLGQENVVGFGLVGIGAVIIRAPFSGPAKKTGP